MEKIYIVSYSTGSYEDWYPIEIFATSNKELAVSYVEKFNKLLDKWDSYYSELMDSNSATYEQQSRYYIISDINRCYYKEIEIR